MSLAALSDLLSTLTGLDPGALGVGALARAVQARRPGVAGETLTAYVAEVARDAVVRAELVSELLVHETSFFRYPASFEALVAHVRARLADPAARVRVLSAPCSTGQEPASVVIALLEAGVATHRVDIDAVDVSPVVVARARAGRYLAMEQRGLSEERRARFLVPDGAGARLRPEVLDPIRFATGDLLRSGAGLGGTAYDVVLCRNLLIYLTPPARLALLETLERMLRPDGLLLLGHAEVPAARSVGFRTAPPPDAYAVQPPGVPVASAHPPEVRRAQSVARASLATARPPPPPVPAPPAPGAAPPLLAQARALIEDGHEQEALALLERERDAQPRTVERFHLMAVLARALERPDAVEQALTRALYLDPDHVPALRLAALVARERGDAEKAERLEARARRAQERAGSAPA